MSLARLHPVVLAVLCALSASAFATEAPLSADAYVSTVSPAANYGATATLNVGAGASTLLRFDLSALPDRMLPANLLKANLLLYVNRIGVPGSVEVNALGSAWSESAVTAGTVPATERGSRATTAAVTSAGQYIAVDVTDKVMAWIAAGNTSNFGFVIQASAGDPSTTVFFDSKENTGTGHAARLDLTMVNQGQTGAQGLAGLPGLPGPAGSKGAAGTAGAIGATGSVGPVGLAGAVGTAGLAGATGAAGPAGTAGVAGVAGLAGAQGLKGDTGLTGATGTTGSAGIIGATGSPGAVGLTGISGPVGPAGSAGATGAAGSAGTAGTAGTAGLAGAQGSKGDAGLTGAVGLSGATGATGSPGAVGLTGISGAAGPAGSTGATGAVGPAGIAGVGGVAGLAGAQGLKGDTGLAGVAGLSGATGAVGSTGTAGAAGVAGAMGATGPTGTTGAIGLTGTTGAVGIAGTMGATGVAGATGAAGINGAPGATGNTGVTGTQGATGAAGPGVTWVNVTGITQQAASNTGYMANNASRVTITLPAAPVLGDIIQVNGVGTGGWTITLNSGQSVITQSIPGNLNSVNSIMTQAISGAQYGAIALQYIGSNTFSVLSYLGSVLPYPPGYVLQGGLIWMPVSSTLYTYVNAIDKLCSGTIDNLGGWRLPTVGELSALYTSGLMNNQGWKLNYPIWSSTYDSNSTTSGHDTVYFLTGSVYPYRDTITTYATCVR